MTNEKEQDLDQVWYLDKNLNDRYADEIIEDRWSLYDGIKISGVRVLEAGPPYGTECQVDEVNPHIYSVYAHLKEGLDNCIGDFATYDLAKSYASELASLHDLEIIDRTIFAAQVNDFQDRKSTVSVVSVQFESRWEEGNVTTAAKLDLDTGIVSDIEQSSDGDHYESLIGEFVLVGDREVAVELEPDNNFRVDAATLAAIKVELSERILVQEASAPRLKRYNVRARCDGEFMDCPRIVVFEINQELAQQIVRLAELVTENGLYQVSRFDFRADFLQYDPDEDPEDAQACGEENSLRTECDTLVVTADDFKFEAYAKHTAITMSSESQSVAELAAHFDIPFGKTKEAEAQHVELDEDAIRDFLTDRIESGDLPLEDITKMMARYGLMDSRAFLIEMQERMDTFRAECEVFSH